jgi:hypothetical protein
MFAVGYPEQPEKARILRQVVSEDDFQGLAGD